VSSPGQPNGPRFVTPAGYYSRVTDDLIVAIATEVLGGVSPYTAAALYGINRHTFTRWMAWGKVAIDEGGDDRHRHAPYIQLHLTITQAQAWAQAIAERAMYQSDPERWLFTNPLARIDWNPNFAGAEHPLEQLVEGQVVEAAQNNGPNMQLPPAQLRKALQTLIDAGVARRPSGAIVDEEPDNQSAAG